MAGQAPQRILLIDDNQDAARMLQTLLTKLYNHEVITAQSGEEGLAIAAQCPLDLIFIDVGLPRMNGYEVAQALRSRQRTRQTKLVALTGLSGAEEEAKAAAAGIDEFLVKPPDIQRIKAIVEALPSRDTAHTTPTAPQETPRETPTAHLTTVSESASPETPAPPTLAPNRHMKAHRIKRMEQEREALGEIFQTIAHDLGNHLSALQLMIHLANQNGTSSLDQIKGTLDTHMPLLEKLLSHLRQFSKVARRDYQLRMADESVTSLLSGVVDQYRYQHQERAKDIHFTAPTESFIWRCDPGLLRTSFVELMENALAYTSPSEGIFVSITETPLGLEVEVRDEGVGLEESWLSAVFGLFVRAGQPLDRSGRHFGIGLALVESIIQAHRGRASLHSAGLGTGCTAKISLPG